MLNGLRKRAAAALPVVLLASALAGCGLGGGPGGGTGSGEAGEASYIPPGGGGGTQAVRFGLVTDFGGLADGSINQSAWAGLRRAAAAAKSTAAAREASDEADYASHLVFFAENGTDLIWGAGFLLENAVSTVAGHYPEKNFAILDGTVDAPNVASVTFRMEEGAYLAGVVAGSMTDTQTVGFVGGLDTEEMRRYEDAFRAGAESANPAVKVQAAKSGSYTDAELGRQAAAELFDRGADILFHAAGASGDGVFAEAAQRREDGADVRVIGFGKDEADRYGHDVTLTSLIRHYDRAVEEVTRRFAEGNAAFGPTELGADGGFVGLPERSPNLPEEVLQAVAQAVEKIGSGEIAVP